MTPSARRTAPTYALKAFGPAVAGTRDTVRSLTTAADAQVSPAAVAALWDIGGRPEAQQVLDVLLQAMAGNPATANHVVACLDRMGPLAAPALPALRDQLARPRRGGRFQSIDNDEALQRACRALVARLEPSPSTAPAPRTA